MPIHVLVVDDHEMVRESLSKVLDSFDELKVIGTASNGKEAIKLAKELAPDVVVMDFKMPVMCGKEATEKIIAHMPATKIVIISAEDKHPVPSMLMKAGAYGFVSKGGSLTEVVDAIKHAMRGKRYLSPEIAQQAALNAMSNPEEQNPFSRLAQRELQITLMIVEGEKAQDIADKLSLSPKTVNAVRYRVFEKLNITGDVELTRLAMRHGLLSENFPQAF